MSDETIVGNCQAEPSFWWPLIYRWRSLKWRISKWIPSLVWYGQQIDIHITFSEHKLDQSDPMASLFSGRMADIEHALYDAGVRFDRGVGMGGRDWEWDWSLRGPVSVTFIGRARNPERRKEKPRPKLVFSRGAA